ncbi:hypothetical protein IIA28_13880 [candidate division KSB1 bacterium]|nr:hypothetical protein [candidate division KSB1 bacterium]
MTLRSLTFATAVGILYYTGNLFYQSVEQTQTSKDISHRQLRAYLVIIEPQLKVDPQFFFRNINKRVEMSYIVKNSGQTPAYDVRDSVNIKIWPREAKPQTMPESVKDFNYPVYGPNTQNTRKIHSGDSNILTQRYFIPNTNTFDTVNYGIYFWGRIEYSDIFNKTHFTNFCYEFIFDEPIDEFRTYETCNDADRD